MLTIRNLRKSFPGEGVPLDVLRGVDLDLAAGRTLALTGESGSGKSTLLHLVGGLDRPDAGTVSIDGHELTTLPPGELARMRREVVAIVFQQFNLIPSLSVAANIAFQARLAGRYDSDRVTLLIDRLGLGGHEHKYPEQLSGGQQQRVAIGRALALRPRLVLADEPTGNLDEATGEKVLGLMLELVSETGAGLLMVTHSERLAGRLDQRRHLARGRLVA